VGTDSVPNERGYTLGGNFSQKILVRGRNQPYYQTVENCAWNLTATMMHREEKKSANRSQKAKETQLGQNEGNTKKSWKLQ